MSRVNVVNICLKGLCLLGVVFDSFVRELHQQLMTCMNHFIDELKKYESAQVAKMKSRDETLHREMSEAQQIISDIELLLQSRSAVECGGKDVVNRSMEFFQNCIDIGQGDDDFAYVDFVPSGHLYVRAEHLGYFRFCDAVPEEVELRPATRDEAVCKREFTVLIETNHSNCVNAEPYLDVELTDDVGGPVQFRMLNNKDGSYGVVFMPTRPGRHQLNVRLFGLTVNSSPMEIPVANEPVTPDHMSRVSHVSAANVSVDMSCTSSHCKSGTPVGCVQNSTLQSSLRKFATPCLDSLDDGEYFAASLSPHSAVISSPGSAGTGTRAVPVKQEKDSLMPDFRNSSDCENIRRSLHRMSIDPVSSAGDRRGSWPSPASEAQVSDPPSARSTIPSCAIGAAVEFDEPEDYFDTSGYNYCNILLLFVYFATTATAITTTDTADTAGATPLRMLLLLLLLSNFLIS